MIVWLDPDRQKPPQIHAADGVVRADEFACAIDIESAYRRARDEAREIVAQAERQAAALLKDAQRRADELDEESRKKWVESERLGHEAGHDAGRRDGLDEIFQALHLHVRDQREAARRAEQRLADTVMRAVEQIVMQTDRQALYARVGILLQRVVDAQTYVRLVVHPSDFAHASAMLEHAARTAGWSAGYEVVQDEASRPGDCRCEWDYGLLDAGLDAQLAAVRRALVGARAEPEHATAGLENRA
jgi:type III secretion protein L